MDLENTQRAGKFSLSLHITIYATNSEFDVTTN